jgi:tellurite methyltransferase
MSVPRTIEGFVREDEAPRDWIALLDCGHRRHVRHRPPLSSYPWVADEDERARRIGSKIECDRCMQLLLPEGVAPYKETPEFDERSLPAGLRRAHTTRRRVWGRLLVLDGHARLRFEAPIDRSIELGPGDSAAIPPEIPHAVTPGDRVRLRVVFLRIAPTKVDE